MIELIDALADNKVLLQKEKFEMIEEILEPKIKKLWKFKSKNPKFTVRLFTCSTK